MKSNVYFVLYLVISFWASFVYAQWGVVIKPVADCFCEPVPAGQLLPAAYINQNTECKRCAQILYNEMVPIVSTTSHFYEIEYPGFFYLKNDKPCNIFFIEKNALFVLPFDSIDQIKTSKFPAPKDHTSSAPQDLLILAYPWHDSLTNITFSAGTRFLRSYNDSTHNYGIFVFDPKSQKFSEKQIPRNKVFINNHLLSAKDKQQLYVSLIRKWIQGSGVIPYVWGGMSFTHKSHQKKFSVVDGPYPFANWGESLNNTISGCDCSGLIVLATQILQIPYPYRNTGTLSKMLRPLQNGELIENGDLLWFNGHVVIVSDIHKNLIIEAAGYKSGFGKVQEIPLHKRFKNIRTFNQLRKLLFEQKPISVLNSQGHETRVLNNYQIYKFSSLYDDKSIQKD